MKQRMILLLLGLTFLGTVSTQSVQAGWFDKKNKEETPAKTHRYNVFPTMSFHVGTLRRDTYSGWKLDDTPLQFMPKARITAGGQEVQVLNEGTRAIIMGEKVGETLVAWRVRIMESDWNVDRDTSRDGEITWSTSDPTVGESPTKE